MGGTTRPPAHELLPVMLEDGHPKLSAQARPHAAVVRCPRRHLLGAAVRTPHGVWVLWRGNLFGRGWRCQWLDEIADPAAMPAWCSPCRADVWALDMADPACPERRPMR